MLTKTPVDNGDRHCYPQGKVAVTSEMAEVVVK